MLKQLQTEFEQNYQQLNPAQQKAVDQIEGPMLVSAGPGTGKTQVLTMRIANILKKTDTNPSSILALTFTQSAAQNMRERLIKLIGQAAYYVRISTFHGFAQEVIQDNPEYFSLAHDSQAITDLERYELFRTIIDKLDLLKLRPLNDPYMFLKKIITAVSDLKREGISLAVYEQLIKDESAYLAELQANPKGKKVKITKQTQKVIKNQELYQIYASYQQNLQRLNRFDFDDMINFVVSAFEQHEILLRDYQENIHYFLVDEYQDTNNAQNKILQLLANYWQDQANVCVVGDPHQAIYRFQGASVENMLGFFDLYPQAKHVYLETGYRCPQEIYNQAHQLISHNLVNLDKIDSQAKKQISDLVQSQEPLQSVSLVKTQVQLYAAPSQMVEALFVADQVKTLLAKGVKADKVAILYRDNADMVDLANILAKWQIPFEVNGGNNVLTNEEIIQLLHLFKTILAIRNVEEKGLFYQLLQYQWLHLDSLLIMKLGRLAGKLDVSIYDLIEAGYDQALLNIEEKKLELQITKAEWQSVAEVLQKLTQWSQLDFQVPFTQWFEQVLKDSGYLDWVLQHQQKTLLLLSLNALYSQIKNLVYQNQAFKLADFIQAIDTMQEHGMIIQAEDFNVIDNRVTLATVHKAKGREWDYVFLYQVMDKKWGNKSNKEIIPLPDKILSFTSGDLKEKNDDERRLFYVALTRAKKQLMISYPKSLIEVGNNQSKAKISSLFLHELTNFEELKNPTIEQQAESFLPVLLQPVSSQVLAETVQADQQAFFSHLVKNFSLSVTALNSYLRDPQEFTENFLLRVPKSKPAVMAFGTAVHAALESLYRPLLNQELPISVETFLANFEQALKKEILSPSELEKRLKHGQVMLNKYYQYFTEQIQPIAQPMFIERAFGKSGHNVMLNDIRLNGRIDRIDWVDEEKKIVKVIDYKTGSAKSANQIDGKVGIDQYSARELALPEEIRGQYKRQLLFYKLLADLDKSFLPTVKYGVFEFVEAKKETDKIKQAQFELKDEDVSLLKELIIQVMTEIRNLEFLNQSTK